MDLFFAGWLVWFGPKRLTDKRLLSPSSSSSRSGIKDRKDYLIRVRLKARDAPLHTEHCSQKHKDTKTRRHTVILRSNTGTTQNQSSIRAVKLFLFNWTGCSDVFRLDWCLSVCCCLSCSQFSVSPGCRLTHI